jgi:hypothetical protein
LLEGVRGLQSATRLAKFGCYARTHAIILAMIRRRDQKVGAVVKTLEVVPADRCRSFVRTKRKLNTESPPSHNPNIRFLA